MVPGASHPSPPRISTLRKFNEFEVAATALLSTSAESSKDTSFIPKLKKVYYNKAVIECLKEFYEPKAREFEQFSYLEM
jgi:hypothetical protein